MITRTLTFNSIQAIVFNPHTKEVEQVHVKVPITHNTIKYIESLLGEGYKVCTIIKSETLKELRGMSNEDWLKYSGLVVDGKILTSTYDLVLAIEKLFNDDNATVTCNGTTIPFKEFVYRKESETLDN